MGIILGRGTTVHADSRPDQEVATRCGRDATMVMGVEDDPTCKACLRFLESDRIWSGKPAIKAEAAVEDGDDTGLGRLDGFDLDASEKAVRATMKAHQLGESTRFVWYGVQLESVGRVVYIRCHNGLLNVFDHRSGERLYRLGAATKFYALKRRELTTAERAELNQVIRREVVTEPEAVEAVNSSDFVYAEDRYPDYLDYLIDLVGEVQAEKIKAMPDSTETERADIVNAIADGAERAAKTDLFERARFLGYTDGSAARVADCSQNWDMVLDPCPKHPNHSTTIHDGYMIDMCEACEIISRSDADGYTLEGWQAEQARRVEESARLQAREAFYVARDEYGFCLDGRCGQCSGCLAVADVIEDGLSAEQIAFAEAERDAAEIPWAQNWVSVDEINRLPLDSHCSNGRCGSCALCALAAERARSGERFGWTASGEYKAPSWFGSAEMRPTAEAIAWALRGYGVLLGQTVTEIDVEFPSLHEASSFHGIMAEHGWIMRICEPVTDFTSPVRVAVEIFPAEYNGPLAMHGQFDGKPATTLARSEDGSYRVWTTRTRGDGSYGATFDQVMPRDRFTADDAARLYHNEVRSHMYIARDN